MMYRSTRSYTRRYVDSGKTRALQIACFPLIRSGRAELMKYENEKNKAILTLCLVHAIMESVKFDFFF